MCREMFAKEEKNSAVRMKVDLAGLENEGSGGASGSGIGFGTMLLPNGIIPAAEPMGKSSPCEIRIWGVSFSPWAVRAPIVPFLRFFCWLCSWKCFSGHKEDPGAPGAENLRKSWCVVGHGLCRDTTFPVPHRAWNTSLEE